MEFVEDHRRMAVSSQVLVDTVRDAHEFFKENRIDESFEHIALDLIRRYVSQEGEPREVESLFGAALFIVSRHPWSHPNPLTKNEFASRLRMKESSLEWYTDSIAEKLGFLVLHDRTQLPFYVDPQGTIASVVISVVRGSVGEEVVKSIVTGSMIPTNILCDRIVDRLCNVVKIVPTAFEQELYSIIEKKIEEESSRLLNQIDAR